jgi:hypothetical protein
LIDSPQNDGRARHADLIRTGVMLRRHGPASAQSVLVPGKAANSGYLAALALAACCPDP